MKNSQLIKILKIFSEKEIKEFNDFIRSPFFNKNESVILFFNYLKKYYSEFPEKSLEKKEVFSKIFPGTAYNDGFMRKTMFTLSQLAEKYISYKGFSENKLAENEVLLKEYFARSSPALFNKAYKDFQNLFTKNKEIGGAEFYYAYTANRLKIDFASNHKYGDFIKFASKNNLLEPFEYLAAYSLFTISNLYEYYLNTKKLYNFEFDEEYFKKIISSFDEKLIRKHPLLHIQSKMLKMLTEPENVGYFQDLKKLLEDTEDNMESFFLENVFVNMQNYCMRKIRVNKEEFTSELFNIYRMELERINYSVNNPISTVLYKNVVFTALQLNETGFAENFAEKYKKFLTPELFEPNYYYVKAHIAFKKQELENVAKNLSKIRKMDEMLKIDVKSLTLILYYETNAHEQFWSNVDSYKHFLKVNAKLPESRKSLYYNFINFAGKLKSLKEKKNTEKLIKLKQDISICDNVINKNWLIEKASQL